MDAARALLALLVLSLCLTGIGMSQQASCSVEFPVSVVNPNLESFRGLSAADFSAHAAKTTIPIKSITFDDGPRRVVLVVETGKKINSNSRKAEIEMVQAMVADARPGDSFALIATQGPNRMAKFGSDRAKLIDALGQEWSAGKDQGVGVLDAVMEGVELFGQPATGDAIVVIAAELQGSRKANAKSVAKALEEHHIRMLGLALGPVATKSVVAGGTMTSTTSQGLAYTTPLVGESAYETGDEDFFPLTVGSGGLVLGVIGGQKQTYNLDDPKVKQMVAQKARHLFQIVAAFYRMQIDPPPLRHREPWSVDVVESIHQIAPRMFILYPSELGPC